MNDEGKKKVGSLNTNPQKWNQRHRKELIMEDDRGDQVN
jgi:hypothetical protein